MTLQQLLSDWRFALLVMLVTLYIYLIYLVFFDGRKEKLLISRKTYEDMATRLSIAENLIKELPIATQKSYLDSCNTWGTFSREIYQNVKKDRLDRLDCGRCSDE